MFLWKKKKKKNKLNIFPNSYQDIIENILYFLPNSNITRPKIIDETDTIKLISKSKYSITRFGDGELELIMGRSIPYQKYNPLLSRRLREILSSNQENLMVGINYSYFYPMFNVNESQIQIDFLINSVPKHRKDLLKHINFEKQYYASDFTGIKNPKNKIYENHFNTLRNVWENKEIVVVGCKQVKEKIQYDIFDNASNINYIYCKNKNSWDDYNDIIKQCKKFSKNVIIILMCGPSAKVIASDLCKLQYRSLDLGHIAKSYDFYKKGIEPNSENVIDFFSPDLEVLSEK